MYFSFSHPRRYYGAGNRDVLTWKHEKLFHPAGCYRSQTNPFVASEEEGGRACTERVYYDFMVQSPPPLPISPPPLAQFPKAGFSSRWESILCRCARLQLELGFFPSPQKKCSMRDVYDYSHSLLRRRQPDPLA